MRVFQLAKTEILLTRTSISEKLKEVNLPKLIISLTLCFSVAFIGSTVTLPSIGTWYETLQKPFFTPPNWIFGPVWTLLYLLMAIAFADIWTKVTKKNSGRRAIHLFLLQLLLNFLWSLSFFGLHMPVLAFLVIVLLWISILYTMLAFKKISKIAAWLLLPYIVWVSFALFLNLFIVILN